MLLILTGSADGITPPPPPPEPNDTSTYEPSQAAAMAWMARRNFAYDGDAKSALRALPRSMVKERTLLRGMSKVRRKREAGSLAMPTTERKIEERVGGDASAQGTDSGGDGWTKRLSDEDAATVLMELPLRDRTFCECLIRHGGRGIEEDEGWHCTEEIAQDPA